jgi:hypothetical protein
MHQARIIDPGLVFYARRRPTKKPRSKRGFLFVFEFVAVQGSAS